METNHFEKSSAPPEGDSVCLICLQLYNDENKETDTAKLLHFQNIFDNVSTYLSADIFASCFQWNFIEEGVSPVCSPCFTYMEKIFKIGQQLSKLQSAIELLIKTFTEQVEAHHSNLQFLYTKRDPDESPSTCETRDNNIQDLGDHRRLGLESSNESVYQKDDEPPKTAQSSELNAAATSKTVNLLNISTAKAEGSNCTADVSTSTTTINSYSNTNPITKSLRIALTRLQFDSKGKLITKMEAPRNLKKYNKKTNSVLKPDLERKDKTDKEEAIRNGNIKTNGYDDFKTFLNHDEAIDEEFEDENIYQKKSQKFISNYHNIVKRFKCQDKGCQSAFNFRKEIEAHSLESGHINEKMHKCEECSKSFFRHVDLKLHITSLHFKSKILKCKQCSKTFTKENILRFHYYCRHSQKVFQCEICDKRFLRKVNYENHVKLHNRKTLECKKCLTNFCWRLSVIRHFCSKKFSDKRQRCNICSKIFINRLLFGRHRLTHFKTRIGKYIACSACKKFHFVERAWDKCIIRHFREGKTNSFICAICSSFFKTAEDLDEHSARKKHANKKHFFCFVCRKPHYSSRDLREHLNCHKNGNPVKLYRKKLVFKCPICDEKFKQHYLLEAHMKKHKESDKELSCHICKKKFKYKHNLDDHLNTHTGKKPHKCKMCDKSFYQRNELFRHSKYCTKSSETESFLCGICDKVFKDEIKYRKHMKVHKK